MQRTMKATIIFIIATTLGFWVLIGVEHSIRSNNVPEKVNTNQLLVENQKLKSENDSLIAELAQTNQLFDRKEEKYIKVIARYEYGIGWVKSYHRNVYEEFHRILAFKETYSREAEVQTKKELKDY